LAMSGIQFKIHNKIIYKLERAGATSREKAVTIEEAALDLQEQYWLHYFAGVFLGRIKKKGPHRYYI